jgi:hypothetical protein
MCLGPAAFSMQQFFFLAPHLRDTDGFDALMRDLETLMMCIVFP